MSLKFEVLATDGPSRLGRLALPHGVISTPAFMPVGTLGAVKALGPGDLRSAGASIMLANLYHLALRPGIDVVTRLGGIHAFTGWSGPILTDSGGFQVFSLAALRAVDPEGVTFRSHLNGDELRLTPESVVDLQMRMGVDIAMVLDECPPWPIDRGAAAESLQRTHHWAELSRQAWSGGPSGLFGIIQGSVFSDLRRQAVEQSIALDFDGYAVGGVSVGEPWQERRQVVEITAPLLPREKPRYLMGLGTPLDILHAVRHGVDMFDCVLPTRNARHAVLFTRRGLLKIRNARFRSDPDPIDDQCSCSTCREVSRGFLHHLFRCGEVSASVLATRHNLRFYLDFAAQVREAIAAGALSELAREIACHYPDSEPSRE